MAGLVFLIFFVLLALGYTKAYSSSKKEFIM